MIGFQRHQAGSGTKISRHQAESEGFQHDWQMSLLDQVKPHKAAVWAHCTGTVCGIWNCINCEQWKKQTL